MFAIVMKEIRQNGKWAAMAASIIAGIVAAVAYQDKDIVEDNLLLVNPIINGLLVLGFSAAGLLLGVLAIQPDRATGRWALLTHRPMSRSGIFLAKFVAGVALLAVAGSVPLAVLGVEMVMPETVAAPFDWHMFLPGAAELMGGACCLAAGMLTAARRGRLAGSRLLPALAALLACGCAELMPHALIAAWGILLLATAILLIVGCGAFVFNGEYEPQPAAIRAMHVAVLGVGLFAVMSIIIGIALAWMESLHPGPEEWPPATYELEFDGRVFPQMSFSGRPAFDLLGLIPATPGSERPLIASGNRYAEFLGRPGRLAWYYLPYRRTVEAYDEVTRRYAGSIGPAGFSPGPPAPFPVDLMLCADNFLIGGRGVWLIDLQQTRAIPIFTAPLGERVIAFNPMSPQPLDRGIKPAPIVVTQSAAYVLQPKKELRIPLGGAARGTTLVEYARPSPDRHVLLLLPQNIRIEANGAGQVIAETQLPALARIGRFPPWERWFPGRVFAALTAPPALVPLDQWAPVDPADWRISLLSGLLASVVGFVLLRRYPLSTTGKWWWIAVCAALGWAGVLLLLCTRTAIVRVKCPACGGKRFVTRERCPRCGTPFPPPGRTGVEIFASHSAVEVTA